MGKGCVKLRQHIRPWPRMCKEPQHYWQRGRDVWNNVDTSSLDYVRVEATTYMDKRKGCVNNVNTSDPDHECVRSHDINDRGDGMCETASTHQAGDNIQAGDEKRSRNFLEILQNDPEMLQKFCRNFQKRSRNFSEILRRMIQKFCKKFCRMIQKISQKFWKTI